MVEFVALVVGGIVLLGVFGLLASMLAALFWLVLLPLKLLALALKGAFALLLVPILFVVGGIVALAVGLPLMLAAALAIAPFVLFVLAIVWLVRRIAGRGRGAPSPA